MLKRSPRKALSARGAARGFGTRRGTGLKSVCSFGVRPAFVRSKMVCLAHRLASTQTPAHSAHSPAFRPNPHAHHIHRVPGRQGARRGRQPAVALHPGLSAARHRHRHGGAMRQAGGCAKQAGDEQLRHRAVRAVFRPRRHHRARPARRSSAQPAAAVFHRVRHRHGRGDLHQGGRGSGVGARRLPAQTPHGQRADHPHRTGPRAQAFSQGNFHRHRTAALRGSRRAVQPALCRTRASLAVCRSHWRRADAAHRPAGRSAAVV